MRRLLSTLALALTLSMAATGATPRWEGVDVPPRVASTTQHTGDGAVDVAVIDGYIYIGATRQVSVKVFTILGQLISQETLPAGSHRLRMTARGVYILKVGESTIRVTI